MADFDIYLIGQQDFKTLREGRKISVTFSTRPGYLTPGKMSDADVRTVRHYNWEKHKYLIKYAHTIMYAFSIE